MCLLQKKNKMLLCDKKRKKNVVVFYSLRWPLRFLSFSARASFRASNLVMLRTSHSAVLVANLEYCWVVFGRLWPAPDGIGAGWKGSAAAAAACSAAVWAKCLRAMCSTVVGR